MSDIFSYNRGDLWLRCQEKTAFQQLATEDWDNNIQQLLVIFKEYSKCKTIFYLV